MLRARARLLGAALGRPATRSAPRTHFQPTTTTAVKTTRRSSSSYSGGGDSSITYSGGQASEGQGGFYGSGGARVKKEGFEWNSKAVAQLEDIKALHTVMAEVAALEEAVAAVADPLSEAAIETKQTIKRLMTAPNTVALVDKLEMGGQPVWGLSTSERDLVKDARRKINTC